ncbi:YqaJ viral recombinase family nuclease [Cytobacillus kochii]|uniref:YqaJ viral recombinase family nuclease n=1 Tax=Cytobacillus kochii TaxID=859143 RepID=UPI00203E6FD1|nr:YqaJ viral recombinase family protein [Cytobacillus kochii]MCM3324269.1 YqaJ viral recombinase family protein [Cytobacillus kochii]MCM3346663.1 YqaJ viral recombinase family protein [Cytobacillus kochii]
MAVSKAISTKDMSRFEWLQERSKGIGGSDASIILGLNKYKTAFELWLEKTGQVELTEISSEAAYWGNEMEEVVAKEFEKRTEKKVRRRNYMFSHPDYYFIKANIDREVMKESALLECKTASAYLKAEWEGDEIPAAYLVQVQHYLAVTGKEKAYIAVLIGGNHFTWKEIERDDELIQMIIDAEVNFWEKHVLGFVPPELDGSSAAEQYLKEKYNKAEEGKEIVLPSNYKEMLINYEQIKNDEKLIQTAKKDIENKIKAELKDAEVGLVDTHIITWKNVISNRVDTKALKEKFPDIYKEVIKPSTSRRFGIKELN